MKIFIFGDSHCRDLDKLVDNKDPSNQVETYIISVGGNTEAIMYQYCAELAKIRAFDPEFIIVHTGNNEMGYHATKNPSPKDSTETTAITLEAANTLLRNHPLATIVLSAAFPRILSRTSPFTFEDLCHYNNTVKRHSTRLRSEAAKQNFQAFLNNFMWKEKKSLLVKTQHYMPDGLHLTETAKKLVINDWIARLIQIQASDQIQQP
jgi:hypothetical protein